jgi:DNA-binding NarL/FixJ family response regulator
MATPRKADVLVTDAEPLARTGLVHLINSHPRMRVCAEAETLARARELCSQHRPHVVVIDPVMGDGCTFIKDLPRWSSGTRAVVVTRLHDAQSVQRAFKAGACGYVTRRDPVAAVIAALLAAIEGRRFAGPEIEVLLLDNLACGAIELQDQEVARLSDRELEVFRLIGRGLGTRAVATELHLSMKTVETHRERIRRKLQIETSGELQRRAVLHCGANW